MLNSADMLDSLGISTDAPSEHRDVLNVGNGVITAKTYRRMSVHAHQSQTYKTYLSKLKEEEQISRRD